MADERWVQPFATLEVSRKLLDAQVDINHAIFYSLTHPPTPEQIAARRAGLEEEWDAKIAAGMVGINDHGDYGCRGEWELGDRGDSVEKWVTSAAWKRYVRAVDALDKAVVGLDG